MNEPIKFIAAADILAFIPHTLGEAPTESFVAVTLQGNRLGATLRSTRTRWTTPGRWSAT